MTVYLTPADACSIHAQILARTCASGVLLDEGKLESALLRPVNAASYAGADLCMQAALVVAGVALSHAFSDGNKRLAAALGVIFLQVNDVMVTGAHLELADQVLHLVDRTAPLGVATERFAAWLRAHSSGATDGVDDP